LVPPPCTAGHALWHSASVVHAPQVPPPLLLVLLPEELPDELPLSSSSPPLLLVLLPEELVLLPELLVLLPEELVLLPPSWPGTPLSPKSNPLVASP
jgi:hypothetical protein